MGAEPKKTCVHGSIPRSLCPCQLKHTGHDGMHGVHAAADGSGMGGLNLMGLDCLRTRYTLQQPSSSSSSSRVSLATDMGSCAPPPSENMATCEGGWRLVGS